MREKVNQAKEKIKDKIKKRPKKENNAQPSGDKLAAIEQAPTN